MLIKGKLAARKRIKKAVGASAKTLREKERVSRVVVAAQRALDDCVSRKMTPYGCLRMTLAAALGAQDGGGDLNSLYNQADHLLRRAAEGRGAPSYDTLAWNVTCETFGIKAEVPSFARFHKAVYR